MLLGCFDQSIHKLRRNVPDHLARYWSKKDRASSLFCFFSMLSMFGKAPLISWALNAHLSAKYDHWSSTCELGWLGPEPPCP